MWKGFSIGGFGRQRRPRRRGPAVAAWARPRALRLELLEGRTLPSFALPISYSSGPNGGPEAVAVGDVNGDAVPDLVVTNNGQTNVGILLGNGDGTFQPAFTVQAGPNPFAVALGDLTGDGHLDIVVTNVGIGSFSEGHTVSVLLNNGDGTFQAPRTLLVGRQPTAVAVGDLLGNGKLDIVTANQHSGSLSVLMGNGDGTFQNAVDIDVGAQFVGINADPNILTLADLRHTGRLDIVVGSQGLGPSLTDVSVLLNQGDGTFAPPQGYVVGLGSGAIVNAVAVGDVNGDGIPDIVTINEEFPKGSVSVLLGNGDGTFRPGTTTDIGIIPISAALADLSGDGKLDLVFGNSTLASAQSALTELPGNGDGTFGSPITLDAGPFVTTVAAADLTGNQVVDLVTTSGAGVTVYRGNGDGTFQTAPGAATDAGPNAIAQGDFTGSGITDLVTANIGSNTVSVLRGNGDGTFKPAVNYPAGFEPRSVAVGDLLNNGKLDIVVVDTFQPPADAGIFAVLLGNGDGTFQAPIFNTVRSLSDFLSHIAVGDLNGDGIPDVAVTDSFNDPLFGFVSGVSILAGNGDGTFRPLVELLLSDQFQVGDLLIGDFNNDGFNDVVAASSIGVTFFPGRGDGHFGQGINLPDNSFPEGLAAADLTGNGLFDFVATNTTGLSVSVFLANGNGTYQPARNYAVGPIPTAVAVGDFNGDGIPDLAVINAGASTLSVLLGNGDGTFQPAVSYLVGSGAGDLTVSDFNRDGSADIAVAATAAAKVSLVFNHPDGSRPAAAPVRTPEAVLPRPTDAAPLGTELAASDTVLRAAETSPALEPPDQGLWDGLPRPSGRPGKAVPQRLGRKLLTSSSAVVSVAQASALVREQAGTLALRSGSLADPLGPEAALGEEVFLGTAFPVLS